MPKRRLTKEKRKKLIAAKLQDPQTTTAQLISLNKLYDSLSGKTKKKGRPPKAKEPVANEEPVADEEMIHGRPKSYFSELDLAVFKLEDEQREIERQKTPEQRATELKELQRKWDAERVYPGYLLVDERGNDLPSEEIAKRRNLAERNRSNLERRKFNVC